MSATYVITTINARLICCLLKDDVLTEVHIDQLGHSLLGNIYVGKVKNVLKNIDAAFVEIAGGQMCFLPLSEAQHPILTNRTYDGRILSGDELLVQVQKDAVKTKDPVLTAKLSVTGTYASVSLGEENGIRYSHKLSAEHRAAIKAALQDIRLPEGMTVVIRTQAQELCCTARKKADFASPTREPAERGGFMPLTMEPAEQTNFTPSPMGPADQADLTALKQELSGLLEQAQRLLRAGRTRTVFSLLTESQPVYLKHLQAFRSFPDRIVTDDLSVFQTLQAYYRENDPSKCDSLSFYQDEKLSLSGLYGLTAKLSEATSKNVWLKSGGYLVIEPTEALTVIDVNTGKYAGKKNTTETFALINDEAALEVARQLRLRNLSGIILVDFINMEEKEEQRRLLSRLREACSQDPVPVRVVDMTPLGLVEITRKKVSRPLAEQLRELKAPTADRE